MKAEFTKVAESLKNDESAIIKELNDAQGVNMDIGGYYKPNNNLEAKAMRPSESLNAIIG